MLSCAPKPFMLSAIMLGVVKLSAIVLSVIMLNVVMLSVTAPVDVEVTMKKFKEKKNFPKFDLVRGHFINVPFRQRATSSTTLNYLV